MVTCHLYLVNYEVDPDQKTEGLAALAVALPAAVVPGLEAAGLADLASALPASMVPMPVDYR